MALRFDLHVHTARTIAGAPTADEIVRRAEEAGLDGVVLTELGLRWSDRELASLRLRTETPLIVLSAEYLILGGLSVIAYGFSGRMPPLDDIPSAVGRIRAEGGTAVVAYPFEDDAPSLRQLVDWGVQGIELYSANGELPSDEQIREVERLGLATVAGSGLRGEEEIAPGDCHTLIDADIRSGRDLAVAIRTGHARAVFGPPERMPQPEAVRPAARALAMRS